MNKGRNSGVTGVVDCIINGQTVQFGMECYWWDEDTAVSTVENTGQGSADLGSSLNLIENGNILLRGKVRTDLIPFPSALKDAQGTVTFTLDKSVMASSGKADVKMVATYRFNKVQFKYDEKTEGLWDMSLGGPRVSALVASGFANNASSTTLTANASGNTYLYAGRQKLYDPQSLINTADQVFNFWGLSADTDAAEISAIGALLAYWTTAPQTSLKVHSVIGNRLSSGVMRIRVHWGLLNTADQAIFPRSMSRRTAMNGYSDSVASLVASGTNSLAVQANSLYTNFTAEDFCWALSLHPMTDGQRLAIKEYRNPGWKEIIRSRGTRLVEARINPTSSTTIEVYVIQHVARGAGVRRITFSPVKMSSRKVRTFVLRRNLTSPIVPEDSGSSINGVTLPNIGTRNGAAFQGIPAGLCIYEGPDTTVTLGLPGITSFPMMAGWRFRSDDNGILDGIPPHMFRLRGFDISTNFTGTGWTNVTTLGAPFTSIVQPATASFAAFLA